GLLAFAIAVPFANLATDNLMKSLASKINFHYSGARFEPIALAVQAILALIVPQVAGFIPILQGTRISVREALSGTRQTDAPDKSWIDRRLTRIRRLSRPFTISLRNVFRNKGRLILTLITLSLGGAVFISVFNVRVSLSNYMEQLSKYFLADLNLTMTRNYRVEEIEQTLGAIHEVASVEAWGLARSSVILEDGSLSEDLNLIAVPGDSTLIDPILLSGRWLLPQDENAIVLNDQFLAKFPDLHIGDTLKLQVNDQETEWVVVGYFQLAGKIGGLAAYVNLDYLVTLPGQIQPKHASSFRVVAHGSHDSADQKALAKEVEGMLAANSFQISAISTGNSMNESSSAGFAILTNLLLILAILTAMVGSIGLTGTMSMNVMDRTREIGVMRSIGASDPLLMRMVMMEGLVIGWISWLIGALLSFPISQLMSDMVTNALFGAPSTFGFTTTGFIIWFAVVSILSIGASFLPARNAARLTIREVLAYE
ncbi:MAG TPA: ABC transporter permease, partial [Anaerolineales bacterium]|nr:ABC transporter permease [Anaerolineales bacterium]